MLVQGSETSCLVLSKSVLISCSISSNLARQGHGNTYPWAPAPKDVIESLFISPAKTLGEDVFGRFFALGTVHRVSG